MVLLVIHLDLKRVVSLCKKGEERRDKISFGIKKNNKGERENQERRKRKN